MISIFLSIIQASKFSLAYNTSVPSLAICPKGWGDSFILNFFAHLSSFDTKPLHFGSSHCCRVLLTLSCHVASSYRCREASQTEQPFLETRWEPTHPSQDHSSVAGTGSLPAEHQMGALVRRKKR